MNDIQYQYQEKLIAFIDILGFKDKIKKSDENIIPLFVDTINSALKDYERYFNNSGDKQARDMMGCKILPLNPDYYIFSDSIVFTMKDEENNLIRFLTAIISLQKSFIKNDIFVRGAILKGKIFESKNGETNNSIVFGPGGVDAYEMESKEAIYPRILLSKEIVDKLYKRYNEIPENGLELLKRSLLIYVLKDNDGAYFLDYLGYGLFWDFLEKKEAEFLIVHKKNILNQLDQIRESQKNNNREKYFIRSKYFMLAEYHDFSCINNFIQRRLSPKYLIGSRINNNTSFIRPFEV